MISLKPCPFCDSKASMRTGHDDDDDITWKYIKCEGCGVSTSGKWSSNGNDCPIFYEEVREQWNRRASDEK